MGRDSLSNASARFQSNVVKALTGYYRLKDFIHAIRGCKTLAEERALVAKESAAIRTSFKEDLSPEQQYHSIAKLMFIQMMGYPVHFGQVESLKMVASQKASSKRLGYLATAQFLDVNQPTLTLITNSIKSDLNDPSQCITSMAISNLSMSASIDIARDLADEVARLLTAPSPYLRKKAAFCAARLVSKAPELEEVFASSIPNLLNDRNNGVTMGGLALVQSIAATDSSSIPTFRNTILTILIRKLQTILTSSSSSENEVHGIDNPFLQIKILKVLCLLGKDDAQASESMFDILTQISSTTDPSKNVGHAILYEAAVTIMSIQSDSSLKTMAINILGRLLSSESSDNNLRYVALNLLHRIIQSGNNGLETVQRHRETILECLHENDISIKTRAADLSLALITKSNIKMVFAELFDLLYGLRTFDTMEFKQSLVIRMAIAAAQFAPSAKWYVDTMIIILSMIDDSKSLGLKSSFFTENFNSLNKKEEIVSIFVRIINNTVELHRYATEELWNAIVLRNYNSDVLAFSANVKCTEALLQACIWTVGEFADVLLSLRIADEEKLISLLSQWASVASGYSSHTMGYIINTLGKLSNRLNPQWAPSIAAVLDSIAADRVNDSDLHYRAKEMKSIVNSQPLRSILLMRTSPDINGDQLGKVQSASKRISSRLGSASSYMNNGFDSTNSLSPSASPRLKPTLDVFSELATLSLDSSSNLATNCWSTPDASFNGVNIYFQSNAMNMIVARIENASPFTIYDIVLLIAAPKTMKLHLEPANSTSAPPGGRIEQKMRATMVSDGSDAPLEKVKLRVKITYKKESTVDEEETHQFDVLKIRNSTFSD